jgi:signal transduction histidine kinase
VVIDPPEVRALVAGVVTAVAGNHDFAGDIRDRRGRPVWNDGDAGPSVADTPLAAVDGWTLRLSPRTPATRRSWRAYGLVGLPLVVLSLGLATMTHVMRREMALVRRQAEFTAAVTHEFKSPLATLRMRPFRRA